MQKGIFKPSDGSCISRSFFPFPVSISVYYTVFSVSSSSVRSSHEKEKSKGLATSRESNVPHSTKESYSHFLILFLPFLHARVCCGSHGIIQELLLRWRISVTNLNEICIRH